MKYLIKVKLEQVVDIDTAVLVLDETGTGKDLLVHAIHKRGLRRQFHLMKLNCAVLPSNLIENELFGHEPVAFTGAQIRQNGRFEVASGTSIIFG